MKITARAALAAAVAFGTASVLAACSSGGGGSSATDLTVPPSTPSSHSAAPSPTTGSSAPSAASTAPSVTAGGTGGTGGTGATGVTANPVTVKVGKPFPTPTRSSSTPPVVTPLPTPAGPVTYVSWAFVRPFNCREHADLVDTAPDVSTALNVTVLLRGVPAGSLSIVAPNRAVRTLSTASSLVSSVSVGHGIYKATYTTYASLFHNAFTPVTFSSLTATAGGAQYTIAFPSPVTVTLDDCHT